MLILLTIFFPWALLPLAFYYAWRRGVIGRLMKKFSVPIKRVHCGGELIEEALAFKYYKPAHDGCYAVIPRILGVRYVYAIEVRDLPERLTKNIEEVIRAAINNLGGQTLILLTIGDLIEKVRVYSVSRVLPRIEKDASMEAFDASLRIADALRPKSPTVKVALCRGKAVIEGLPLEVVE
ncbi:MAG: pex2/pex10/pex12 family protein [Candidatus Methanomethyliaceae archaeon]|nr:pex2/pex10/pex12 family protein [Candidatus Methanomethyliaceae archaeon]